ncbi:radical SAM protein [bacterium]|nr:radical SAM protein [bacterium]
MLGEVSTTEAVIWVDFDTSGVFPSPFLRHPDGRIEPVSPTHLLHVLRRESQVQGSTSSPILSAFRDIAATGSVETGETDDALAAVVRIRAGSRSMSADQIRLAERALRTVRPETLLSWTAGDDAAAAFCTTLRRPAEALARTGVPMRPELDAAAPFAALALVLKGGLTVEQMFEAVQAFRGVTPQEATVLSDGDAPIERILLSFAGPSHSVAQSGLAMHPDLEAALGLAALVHLSGAGMTEAQSNACEAGFRPLSDAELVALSAGDSNAADLISRITYAFRGLKARNLEVRPEVEGALQTMVKIHLCGGAVEASQLSDAERQLRTARADEIEAMAGQEGPVSAFVSALTRPYQSLAASGLPWRPELDAAMDKAVLLELGDGQLSVDETGKSERAFRMLTPQEADALAGENEAARPFWRDLMRPWRNFVASGLPLRPEVDTALQYFGLIFSNRARLTGDHVVEAEQAIGAIEEAELEAIVGHDRWLRNFCLNLWEFARGRDVLASYPWNISLPIADICNARCIFCTSWFEGKALVKVAQLEAFSDVISNAVYIGLVGHGEPMAHPQFDKICELMARHMDPRATVYTITNGVFLKKWGELLERVNLTSVSISLNAATQETHEAVMGLGDAFPDILDGIRNLCRRRDRMVSITMVVTQQNFHEIPEFIALGEELGVSQIWLRSLLPQSTLQQGLNYHVLPPNLHPDFPALKARAVEAIARSRVPVQADPEMWDKEIFSPRLKEEIRRNPPQMVSREEVLRNRTLRGQSDGHYKADAKLLRGQRLDQGDHTEVVFVDGLARVRTRAAPWAVSVTYDLAAAADVGKGEVRFDVTEVDGVIGVGLLDAGGGWVGDRIFLEASGPVRLAYDAPRTGLKIAFENARQSGGASTFRFGTIEHVVSGAGDPILTERIEPTSAIVHSPVDPLEDGANPIGRTPRFHCHAPYHSLYVNEMFYRVVPCCFMTRTPGFEELRFDGSTPFDDAWNSPAMVELRRRLRDGPLFAACRKCPEKW